MVRVYRVQHDTLDIRNDWDDDEPSHTDHTGVGPYRSMDDEFANELMSILPWEGRPVCAKLMWGDRTDLRCGFVSIQQLTAWFPKAARERLREKGFKIVRYNVPSEHVYQSDPYQVAFSSKHAERI